MIARKVKDGLLIFKKHFPATQATTGWYFSPTLPSEDQLLRPAKGACLFQQLHDIADGKHMVFSATSFGCPGAGCYLGFTKPHEKAGDALAKKEKFKSKEKYGTAFYKEIHTLKPQSGYLIMSCLESINDKTKVEVVNYWTNPQTLSGLVTLANFDRPDNNNVIIPFASGCQSMWTLPYGEKSRPTPKAVVGAMDPAMRRHTPPDSLLFSMPANRFLQLAENISSSFASGRRWLMLIEKSNE